MSLSITGSGNTLAAQLIRSMRDASHGSTASSSSATSADSTSALVDSTGASPAMMAFLAQLSATPSGGAEGNGAVGGAAPAGKASHGHGPRLHLAAGAAAGTASEDSTADLSASATEAQTSSSIAVGTATDSRTSDGSLILAAFDEALQSLTSATGTSGSSNSAGDKVLPPSPPPADTSNVLGSSSVTAPDAMNGRIQAFRQALQAYAAQSGSASRE